MKVLAIAGHADDVELGLGGTLARHSDNGDDVTVVLVTHYVRRTVAYRP
jgi:LmbE family N-acetylglucosaminyl deacetylase